MTYVFTVGIVCLFRRILGLGLIRETLINTALELAYYVQADIVACSNKFVVFFLALAMIA